MNRVGLIVYGSYFSSGDGFTIECTYRQFSYKKVHGSNVYRGCVHMSKAGKILSNFTSSIAPLRTIRPLCK